MREQILMPAETSTRQETCHAEFVWRTQLEKLPLATVGSEVREGKRRIQVGSRVLSSPDHLWQPWPHERERKRGLRNGESKRRKRERGRKTRRLENSSV